MNDLPSILDRYKSDQWPKANSFSAAELRARVGSIPCITNLVTIDGLAT